jgi:regulator of protease activity HflC (stomatin/prohibitin superfamily)
VLLLALPVVLLVLAQFSIHRIPEGHVGVYSRGGALVPGVTEPGYHFMVPFVDSVAEVQVTVQTYASYAASLSSDTAQGQGDGHPLWHQRRCHDVH